MYVVVISWANDRFITPHTAMLTPVVPSTVHITHPTATPVAGSFQSLIVVLLLVALVYCITADGWTKKFSGDMNELHYGQYAKEKEAAEAKRNAERKDEKQDHKMSDK